jgi:hypothetical protein
MRPQVPAKASVELYWLPLGAGGWFVRLNGRIWEAVHARLEHRRPLDLYHTALLVRVPEGRFVVENCWPIPNADGPSRGVLVEGPVASRRLGRWRVFRYEVRCWPDGAIADAEEAVASPQLLSDDPVVARRLLELVCSLPSPVWGRDELGTGEMWNSNSVIAWLLAQAGLPTDAIRPPRPGVGGRDRLSRGTNQPGPSRSRRRERRARCPKVSLVRIVRISRPILKSCASTCSTCIRRSNRSRTGGTATPWRRRRSGKDLLTG